jgi:hypothetical protein
VPASTILDARDRILASLGEGPRRYLVATSSHCHALATVLDVNDLTARAGRLLG